MSRHTCGDWTVAFYAIQDGAGGTSCCAVKAGSRTLARTACQVVTEEDEANIRLMAAAPNMLDALDDAESFIVGFEDDETQEPLIVTLLGKIRSAKAKATTQP
jgi:hypothetical protein